MHSGKTHTPDPAAIQRKMDVQKSLAPPPFALSSSPVQKKKGQASGGSGGGNTTGMPDQVKAKMESSMQEDFSNVKIKTNSGQAEQAGALAYAQGNEVHFASGQYNPSSTEGQKLLGHELGHIKQQREGRVKATGSVNGMALNDDKALEGEADRMGDKAAQAKVDPSAEPQQFKKSGSDNSTAPVQRFKMRASDMKRYPKFAAYMQNEIPKSHNDARLTKYLEHFGTNTGDTARDIPKDMQWGQGPEIRPYKMSRSDVSFRSGEKAEIIRLNRADIEYFEKSSKMHQGLNDLVIESNVMNGYTQFLDDQDGMDKWGKEGDQMEKAAFGRDIHSTLQARKSRKASFGQGEWEVKMTSADCQMPQRMKVWNSSNANGHYEGVTGSSFTVKSRPMNNWSFVLEHNQAGQDAKKGWKRNEMITTQDSADKFTVRSDYDNDRDRNDFVVTVTRKRKTTK
ncbi:MAG TPA: DUF4157 domain-containing protein [Bacteroidetes bacterium]|nr:DUF4157 domain-containing protein [Bacteroidota bacterium]